MTLGSAGPAAVDAAGYVRVRPVDGSIRYEAWLAFGAGGSGGRVLTVDLGDFTPQGTFASSRVQVLSPSTGPMGANLTPILRSDDCKVTLTDAGRGGSLSCVVREPKEGGNPTHVEATWRAEGPAYAPRGNRVAVTWAFGDHFVSHGTAIGWWDPDREPTPGIYVVPDVRIAGDPLDAETLRIIIRSYTGDGAYSGEDVDPALQNVHGDSPRIASRGITLAAFHDQMAVSTDTTSELWTPIFGPCTATVSNSGTAGSIACAADPQHRNLPTAGSTTLVASWSPAPN